MRSIFVAVLAFLAAGCQTPGEVLTNDVRLEVRSTKNPQEAAYCVAANAERIRLMMNNTTSVTTRPGLVAGSFEVVSASWGSAYSVTVVAPAPGGSRITVRHRPAQPVWGTGTLAEQLARGC